VPVLRIGERVIRNRVWILHLSVVVVLALLGHCGCVGGSGGERCWALNNRSPLGRVFQTAVARILVWIHARILVGSAVVNIAGNEGLVARWGGQIGSAGSKSVRVTAAEVLVARDVPVPTASRELLEVGVQIVLVSAPAGLLLQVEDYTSEYSSND